MEVTLLTKMAALPTKVVSISSPTNLQLELILSELHLLCNLLLVLLDALLEFGLGSGMHCDISVTGSGVDAEALCGGRGVVVSFHSSIHACDIISMQIRISERLWYSMRIEKV
jgi:hypothetical protein